MRISSAMALAMGKASTAACQSGAVKAILSTILPTLLEAAPAVVQSPVCEEQIVDMTDCIRRVRERDEGAARFLMERLYPLVLKVVRSYLPWRMSEEDLVQTVFMKMFANLAQFEGRVPVEHWVSRIAVNTCLSALKAERVRPELRWADLSEEGQAVVESLAAEAADVGEVDGLAARELVHQLLSQLNPADRMVVTLLHLEQKSVAEIKAITGWSETLVKVRAFRARKKLKKILARLEKTYESR